MHALIGPVERQIRQGAQVLCREARGLPSLEDGGGDVGRERVSSGRKSRRLYRMAIDLVEVVLSMTGLCRLHRLEQTDRNAAVARNIQALPMPDGTAQGSCRAMTSHGEARR